MPAVGQNEVDGQKYLMQRPYKEVLKTDHICCFREKRPDLLSFDGMNFKIRGTDKFHEHTDSCIRTNVGKNWLRGSEKNSEQNQIIFFLKLKTTNSNGHGRNNIYVDDEDDDDDNDDNNEIMVTMMMIHITVTFSVCCTVIIISSLLSHIYPCYGVFRYCGFYIRFSVAQTQCVGVGRWVLVENFHEKNDDEDEYGGGVEVGHVEERSETTREGI